MEGIHPYIFFVIFRRSGYNKKGLEGFILTSELDDKEISLLWEQYGKKKEREIRDKLVEHYLPMVNLIAGRLAISLPAHIERDDLISSGFFGLLDAVDRYDVSRGNKFETYAGTRIRGSMLDYLRSKDWIPISLRARIKEYEKAVARLESTLGRVPTDEETAGELGITVQDLHRIEMEINVSTVVPLEDYLRQETEYSTSDPTAGIEKQELKKSLAKAIDKLSEKERIVISLYYFEELTLREIGMILHLTEARICQIHSKAVMRLRGFLAAMDIDSI